MKIVKPLTLGVLTKPYRYRRSNRLALAVYGFFRLGGAAPGRFLSENLQWPAVLANLPAEQALDEVMPKQRGEILLAGRAHAPGGQAVHEMQVRLSCAGVDKALRIVGDRQWYYGLIPWYRITRPQPFTSLPIGYERAFGGPRHPGNLIGRGYSGNPLAGLVGANRGLLPNVEQPGRPITRHWRRAAPAGFGPLDLRWTPRQGRGGTYDAAWLAEDAPGLARDIDWRIFNRAPEDQWLPGFFQGGEAYRLEGLHSGGILAGTLPRACLRAFIQRQGMAGIEEVPLNWDTVWFLPEGDDPAHPLGVAVWHGETEIADSDGLDVAALMAGYEDMDQPRALEHYRQVFAWRTDPAEAALHAFNEAELAPAQDPAEAARLAAAQEQAAAQQAAAREAQVADLLAEVNAQLAEAGLPPQPAPQLPPPALQPPSPAAIAAGDFDLSGYLAQARQLAADAQAQAETARQSMAEEEALLQALQAEQQGQARDEVDTAEQAWQEALHKASQPALDLVGGSADSDEDCRQLLELWAGQPAPGEAEGAQRRASLASVLAAKAEKRAGRRAAPSPAAAPLPASAAARLGQQILAWAGAGICLAGRDLAGANLRGANLAGADLRQALLEHADLQGANLAGAQLQGAVFAGARLEGADFSGAQLQGANFSASQGADACFKNADLSQVLAVAAHWPRADLRGARLHRLTSHRFHLEGARLDGAEGESALLPEANLKGCTAYGARLTMAVAWAADCRDADYSGAQLDTCLLLDAQLGGSRWSGARLNKVQAGGKADWSMADLSSASLLQCGFNGASFAAANLAGAQLYKCDFGRCDLTAADLSGALLSGSLFYGANLSSCRAPGSDWFGALCRKSDFSGADLSDANLVQVELSEARFARTQMQGVRLDSNRRAA